MTPMNTRATHPAWLYVKTALGWWLSVVTDLYPWDWPSGFMSTHHQCMTMLRAMKELQKPDDDQGPFNEEWSELMLETFREQAVAELLNAGYERPVVLTCDECVHRYKCRFAMDAYNTDGDCLAGK